MKFEEFQIGELYEVALKVVGDPFQPLLLLAKDEGGPNRPQQLLFFDLLQCKKRWINNEYFTFSLIEPIKTKDD